MTLTSFTTGSREGDARAPGALVRLLKSRHLSTPFACAEQVHGSLVRVVQKLPKPKKYLGADGLLTGAVGQPLAIFTADCVPIFLSGGGGRVVGLLHAGWRGARGRILAKAVRLLRREWRLRPSQIVVWPGPHIRPCCFEVQWDVARHFPSTRRRSGGRWRAAPKGRASPGVWRVDIAGEIRRQARRLGIRWASKKPLEDCTMHGSRYFSYRRDRTEKRQVSVIMKKEF